MHAFSSNLPDGSHVPQCPTFHVTAALDMYCSVTDAQDKAAMLNNRAPEKVQPLS